MNQLSQITSSEADAAKEIGIMTSYSVKCDRSGFEAAHTFGDLRQAKQFARNELEQIGAPIAVYEFDDTGNLVRIVPKSEWVQP